MATLTKGITFASGDVVTPAKLNQLVDSATVANIVNADIASGAAIAGAKITPDFGSQNITTTGNIVASGTVAAASFTGDGANLTGITTIPAGAVMPFAMSTAPSGWLACDGAEYSKTGTYTNLFAAIGIVHGQTNGSGGAGTSHFRVPDLRGIFVRGSGSQTISGITYNKTFAAKESDAMQGHRHGLLANTFLITSSSSNWLQGGTPAVNNTTSGIGDPISDGTNGNPRTASETRPANIALLYCIKF